MGNPQMKNAVCEAVGLLPIELINFVTLKVWFVASLEEAWAFTFNGSDIQGQSVVILTDELFKQEKKLIRYTILHEIGHVLLGHKNSMGFTQSSAEIRRQEKEADEFAIKYLI
jgi:Zn-dependent protease with chaperone function